MYIVIGSLFAILLGASFPILVILMGKMTDTFIIYQVFHQVDIFPDSVYRYSYYNTTLSNAQNTTEYYDLMNEYYKNLDYNSLFPNVDVSQIKENMLPSNIFAKMSISFDDMVHIYNDSIFNQGSLYVDNFRDDSGIYSLYMALSALLFAIGNYFAISFWAQAAKNQVHRIKLLFFRSIIHQDISWFDTKTSGDFATKITRLDLTLFYPFLIDFFLVLAI